MRARADESEVGTSPRRRGWGKRHRVVGRGGGEGGTRVVGVAGKGRGPAVAKLAVSGQSSQHIRGRFGGLQGDRGLGRPTDAHARQGPSLGTSYLSSVQPPELPTRNLPQPPFSAEFCVHTAGAEGQTALTRSPSHRPRPAQAQYAQSGSGQNPSLGPAPYACAVRTRPYVRVMEPPSSAPRRRSRSGPSRRRTSSGPSASRRRTSRVPSPAVARTGNTEPPSLPAEPPVGAGSAVGLQPVVGPQPG